MLIAQGRFWWRERREFHLEDTTPQRTYSRRLLYNYQKGNGEDSSCQ